jgi:hypothetical protein
LDVEAFHKLLQFDEELEDEVLSQVLIVVCDDKVNLVHLYVENVIGNEKVFQVYNLRDDLCIGSFIFGSFDDGQFKSIEV